MSGFRPATIKVRVYEGQEDLWYRFLHGEADVCLRPTGYRDGTEGEFEMEQRPSARCRCGKWPTYLGAYDHDGYTTRCRGCLRAVHKCTC